MRLVPDTVVKRSIAVLVASLLALHLVGYWAYRIGIDAVVSTARDRALAERIVSIKRAIANIGDHNERDRAAHALSSTSLEVHWSNVSLVISNAPLTERARTTETRLKELVPELAGESIRIGFADDGAVNTGEADAYRHMLLVSVQLPDQSWINFSSPTLGTIQHFDASVLIIALTIGLIIIIIAALLMRWVTQPLHRLALASERFTLDGKPEQIDETGPLEVRRAARAFNTMLDRIQTLVAVRTQALAAVSHDLRTPITRIRLRTDAVDDDMRERIESDLGEMESMISATLDFLRAGETKESFRQIDLASIIETIVDDYADQGRVIERSGETSATMQGRPLALKRAFNNIIQNAIKYADRASISIEQTGTEIFVVVADDGPGVPQEALPHLFEPFYRVEASRSRHTGGTGLGLTIAQTAVLSHGGEIRIDNGEVRGLEVRVRLPKDQALFH